MTQSEKYLKLGLIALSRSTQFGSWFNGHIGAEIITNTFFINEFEISYELENVIVNRIDMILSKQTKFFDSVDVDKFQTCSTSEIENNLEQNLSRLSTAGHGIIFSTLALKAIKALNGWLPIKVKEGIIDLQLNAQKDMPNRYFGYDDYQNIEIDLSDIPIFKNTQEAAKYCLQNQNIFENQKIDGIQYFFQGNQLHDITHSQALMMLEQLEYIEMSKLGLEQLRKQIKLGQNQPPNGEEIKTSKIFDPFEVSFWQRSVKDEHHFKLAYSLSYILKYINDINRKETLATVSSHWEVMN